MHLCICTKCCTAWNEGSTTLILLSFLHHYHQIQICVFVPWFRNDTQWMFFALLFRAFRYVSSCIEKVCSTKITDLFFCMEQEGLWCILLSSSIPLYVVNQCWTYSVVVLVLGGVRHSKKMLLPDCYQVPRVLVHSITSKGKKVEKNCCIGSLTVPLLCYVPYALCIHK